MAALPESIHHLIAELGKLPGIGPRSAERLALHLVQSESGAVTQLAQAILAARARILSCEICGALTESQPCSICQDSRRDNAIICLVERPVDILIIDKSGAFKGKYHVLGGTLSPVNGVGPEDLRIQALEARLSTEPIKEIILALSSDVEGDATIYYLTKRLAGRGVILSRIAHGLPVGSGLEFADELTLGRAIEGRRSLV